MPKATPNSIPTYVGIDPGAGGGIAVIRLKRVVALPLKSFKGACRLVQWLENEIGPSYSHVSAYLELVGGYRKGSHGNIGSAMFQFGRGVGWLEACLEVAGLETKRVAPHVWQRGVDVVPRKPDETPADFKRRLKARAAGLYPEVKVTLATADAILIAEYARRVGEGLI